MENRIEEQFWKNVLQLEIHDSMLKLKLSVAVSIAKVEIYRFISLEMQQYNKQRNSRPPMREA